ncbi:MAG: agmatine deiminase family protein [Anaerolineae bacterium]|jgi:agmatine/peptidylarginine deiminase
MTESVIVTVAPSVRTDTYREFFDDLVGFLARLIETSHPADQVLAVVDPQTLSAVGDLVPRKNRLVGSIPDIWIRDFAPVRIINGNFKFHYSPAYLHPDNARAIERGFMTWFQSLGLEAKPVDLVLDGGNFVYNGTDRAVITERILEDNPGYTRAEIHHRIQSSLQLETVAIIPEGVREKTGHADGMVVWLSEKVLGVARFEEPARSRVLRALEQELPGIELVELPFQPTGEMWEDWESAAGVYVNALSTEHALYIPQFGLEPDSTAERAYRSLSHREVIPVRTGREVRLGGSIHCLTWELSGRDAERVLDSQESS